MDVLELDVVCDPIPEEPNVYLDGSVVANKKKSYSLAAASTW